MKRMRLQSISSGYLKIRNRTFLQWMTFLVALWTVLFKWASALPGGLGYLKYLPDGILLIMLLVFFGSGKVTLRRTILTPLQIVGGFFTYCLFVYLLQYQSLAYFLWGLRNTFRFFIAFFAFVVFFDESDVSAWFKVMDILFWVNAVMSVIQFALLKVDGDFLGGIFGIQDKSNGYTLCLLCVVATKSLLTAFNRTEPFARSMIKCGVSILVAAMAELKVYFFLFALLMVGAAVVTRFSVKKMIYLLLGAIVIMVGAALLVEWFGFQGFFSLKRLWESATRENYSSGDDINRISAIQSLSERIVTNPLQQFFGLGLGNCDTSSFAVCNTPFYQRYGYLHYTWFASAMVFLETGYIGLGIYISFFAVCFVRAYQQYKLKLGNLLYNQLAIIISLLCVILLFYNSSLRIESGYMMYFVLALPFIQMKPEKLKNDSNTVLT